MQREQLAAPAIFQALNKNGLVVFLVVRRRFYRAGAASDDLEVGKSPHWLGQPEHFDDVHQQHSGCSHPCSLLGSSGRYSLDAAQ